MTRPIAVWLSLLGALLLSWGPATGSEPNTVAGLVAWYRAADLGIKHDQAVARWPDSSGNGHDLVDDATGLSAVFVDGEAGGQGAVRIGKANAYTPAEPFSLGEHTIFLVYRSARPGRALFRSDSAPAVGIQLDAAEGNAIFQNGGARPDQIQRYGSPPDLAAGFHVWVLGRSGEKLHAFVDGTDVSGDGKLSETTRVGKFFHLQHTAYSTSDGEGLVLAEMAFFDRFLDESDRSSISAALGKRYGIEMAATEPVADAAGSWIAVAQLSTRFDGNVNAAATLIPWEVEDELDPPFARRPGETTRLYCTRDGTRARVHVALPLTSSVDGANVRVKFRVGGERFLRVEGRSGALAAGESGAVSAEIVTRLDAGDYLEVITLAAGAPGKVAVDPEAAILLVEER